MTDNTQPEALRLAKYVARRKLAKQLDTNEIHSFDSGCDTEAVLLLQDIEVVLTQVSALTAAPPPPTTSAGSRKGERE